MCVCDRKLWKNSPILNAIPLLPSDSLRSRILIWPGKQSLPPRQRSPSLWLWRTWCVRSAKTQKCSCHSTTQWSPSSSGRPHQCIFTLSFPCFLSLQLCLSRQLWLSIGIFRLFVVLLLPFYDCCADSFCLLLVENGLSLLKILYLCLYSSVYDWRRCFS